jgi:dUTPase
MGTEFYGVAENRCNQIISPKTTTPLFKSSNPIQLHDNYIYSNEEQVILPNSSVIVHTDLYIAVPEGYIGLIKQRQTLSYYYDIIVFESIVYPNERNEIVIKMYNIGENYHKIKKNDKIAKILLIPHNCNQWVLVNELPKGIS